MEQYSSCVWIESIAVTRVYLVSNLSKLNNLTVYSSTEYHALILKSQMIFILLLIEKIEQSNTNTMPAMIQQHHKISKLHTVQTDFMSWVLFHFNCSLL